MTKSKNQKRQARLAADEKAHRLGAEMLPRRGQLAHNPRGFVVEARTEGPGVTLRCNRCKATTVGGRKQVGNRCLMTRGCHGHLTEVKP
jgi:hypothetical protein